MSIQHIHEYCENQIEFIALLLLYGHITYEEARDMDEARHRALAGSLCWKSLVDHAYGKEERAHL